MAAIKIAKTNLAVESHPVGVVLGKSNLAVESRPSSAWAAISKTNLAVNSDPPHGAARRRIMFTS